MRNTSCPRNISIWLLILFMTLSALRAEADEVRIGVLAHNGKSAAIATWQAHATYLEQAVKGHQFKIVPLDFSSLYPAVKKGWWIS